MKIVTIIPFSTVEGSNKETVVDVQMGRGYFYKVQTDTYESAMFSEYTPEVPVRMYHTDRSPGNVKISLDTNQLKIQQVYQQAERGLLYVYANDDYVRDDEVTEAFLDTRTIDKCIMTNGNMVTVYAAPSNPGVKLITTDEAATAKYVKEVITISGDHYIFDATFSANGESNYFINLPSVITCYRK